MYLTLTGSEAVKIIVKIHVTLMYDKKPVLITIWAIIMTKITGF